MICEMVYCIFRGALAMPWFVLAFLVLWFFISEDEELG